MKSPLVLYTVLVLALFNIFIFLNNQDNESLFLFLVISAIVRMKTANMIPVLLIPLIFVNLLIFLRKLFVTREGVENEGEGEGEGEEEEEEEEEEEDTEDDTAEDDAAEDDTTEDDDAEAGEMGTTDDADLDMSMDANEAKIMQAKEDMDTAMKTNNIDTLQVAVNNVKDSVPVGEADEGKGIITLNQAMEKLGNLKDALTKRGI